MKHGRMILLLTSLVAILPLQVLGSHLEYKFEVDKNQNKLVVANNSKRHRRSAQLSENQARNQHNSKPNHHNKKSNKRLSKMVELGHLIDKITDRMEKDKRMDIKAKEITSSPAVSSNNAQNRALNMKNSAQTPGSPTARKNLEMPDMNTGLAMAGGAAVLGGGAMIAGGMADNANLEAEIDKQKMARCVAYIKDRVSYDMNTELLESSRGIAILHHRANTIAKAFEEKFGFAFDHLENIMQEMEALQESAKQAMGAPERIPFRR